MKMADEFKGAIFDTGEKYRPPVYADTGRLREAAQMGWPLYQVLLDLAVSALRSAGITDRWVADALGRIIWHYHEREYTNDRMREALADDLRHRFPLFADHIGDRCVVLLSALEAQWEREDASAAAGPDPVPPA